MDIFINSTFAQSICGYRLMRMCDSSFVDIVSANELPVPLYDFFSEDLFKAIWCETVEENTFIAPQPTGSYLGFKGLTGVFNNTKNGIVDIAFFSKIDEIFLLADIANKILNNFNSFSDLLFRSINIDSVGDYSSNKDAFLKALGEFSSKDFPKFISNINFSYRTARDLLHFAVCIGSQDRALKQLPGSQLRFLRQTCIIDENEFNSYVM